MPTSLEPQDLQHSVTDIDLTLLAESLEQLDGTHFIKPLEQFVRQQVAFDNCLVQYAYQGTPLQVLHHTGSEPDEMLELNQRYYDGAYLLDPVLQQINNNPCRHAIYHFRDVIPDNFTESEYYLRFWKVLGYIDDCTIAATTPDGYAIGMSFGRTSQRYTDAEKQRLDQLCRLICAILTLFLQHLKPQPLLQRQAQQTPTAALLEQQIKESLDSFGSSVLTQREQELTLLLLRGHSTRSAAEQMGVSTETIKMHRKNLHTKLDIGSHAELFALFIQALPYQKGENNDPLERYFNTHTTPEQPL